MFLSFLDVLRPNLKVCVGHPAQNQLNSDIIDPELEIPHVKGLIPQDCPPFQTLGATPGYFICTCDWLDINQSFPQPARYKSDIPTTPSLDSINLQEQFIESGKPIYLLDYQCFRQDTNQQPDREIYSLKS